MKEDIISQHELKLREQQRLKKEYQKEANTLEQITFEKEKEMRLNEIKLKELRKL